MRSGPYLVTWKKAANIEMATTIQYTVDKTEVNCSVLLTRDFEFWDMWGIEKARSVNKPADYKFIDFFKDPTKGPLKFLLDKKGEAMTQLCQTVLNEVKTANEQLPQGRLIGQSPSATKVGSLNRDERLNKAQAAATLARESAKRKRIQSMTDE